MRKRTEDGLVSEKPWPHPIGGYEICYRKNGKKHSEYRKDLREAELRCEYWRKTLAPGAPAEEYEHPVHYWGRRLREAADLLVQNPQDKTLSAAARALASLASEGLKTARYLPAPPQKDTEADADLSGVDVGKLTSKELADLLEKN